MHTRKITLGIAVVSILLLVTLIVLYVSGVDLPTPIDRFLDPHPVPGEN